MSFQINVIQKIYKKRSWYYSVVALLVASIGFIIMGYGLIHIKKTPYQFLFALLVYLALLFIANAMGYSVTYLKQKEDFNKFLDSFSKFLEGDNLTKERKSTLKKLLKIKFRYPFNKTEKEILKFSRNVLKFQLRYAIIFLNKTDLKDYLSLIKRMFNHLYNYDFEKLRMVSNYLSSKLLEKLKNYHKLEEIVHQKRFMTYEWVNWTNGLITLITGAIIILNYIFR